MNTEAGAVLLEATTTSIGVGAQQGVSDPTRLRNPLDGPMLIDEVRFNVDPTGAATYPSDYAADIQVQLKLGRTILTKGFVPLWTICLGTNVEVPVGNATQRNAALHIWKLPRPLFVPKGEYLEPIFSNTGTLLNTARTLRVVYAGRALAPNTKPPAQVPVPYAAAFVGAVKATAADTTEQTRESDLVNPFKVPLRVQRFIGRLGSASSGQVDYGTVEAIDAAFQYCLVQMVDSKDKIIVRDKTPFGHLFSVKDRAWNVNALLDPRGFYLAYFTENYSTLTGNGIQVVLGMVGWRPVPAAQLGKE